MIRPLRPFLLVLALLAGAARGDEAPASAGETWYAVAVGGVPAGWMVQRELERDGELVTETVLRLGFRRGDDVQSISLTTRFAETADGRPIRAESSQQLGLLPVESRFDYGPSEVVATFRQGETERVERLALPGGDWLTPARAAERLRAGLAAGSARIVFRTVDPQLGVRPFEVVYERLGEAASVEVGGATRTGFRFRQVQSLAPGLASTVDLAADGTLLRSETPLLGATMSVVLADRETALASSGAPELLLRSFVSPDRAIASPRSTRRAVYDLALDGGELPDVVSAGDQRVVDATAGRVRVAVELGSSPPVVVGDAERESYLAASTWLDHEDPALRAVAEAALEGVDADLATRAEALRVFVGRHLTRKDLNTVLATAREVATTRSGDCTEHAVLLAALLRAAAIPSRLVTGLVYAESFAGASEIFAYHMWTQALVGDRWLDLDATTTGRFDAAHVALSTSSFAGDASALLELGRIAPLMGRLRIAVVEATP